MGVVSYMAGHWQPILERAAEHLLMSLLGVVIAVLIGVPLGILALRSPRLAQVVVGLANTFQTIPALAFVGLLIPLTGLGLETAVVILVSYALLPVVRNTFVGLSNVDAGVVEAAAGMGMTPAQILWQVRVPLALPVLMAGLRIALVMTLGTATIMSLAGAGGLGYIIFDGISRLQDKIIVAGALPAAMVALIADWALRKAERAVTPRGIRVQASS